MKVKIERQALAMIIASAIEHFAKETSGTLYGIREDNYFIVSNTYPHSNVSRTELGVTHEENGRNRVNGYLGRILNLDLVGGFHSHTSLSYQEMFLQISEEDKKQMQKKPSNIELILAIKEFEKTQIKEFIRNTKGGYIVGQTGKYKLNASAYYVSDIIKKGSKKLYTISRSPLRLI